MPETPIRRIAAILVRLFNEPGGVTFSSIESALGITDRTIRNYVRELQNVPELIGENGLPQVYYDKTDGGKILRLRSQADGVELKGKRMASILMAYSLMKFLAGTEIFAPMKSIADELRKTGLKMPFNHLDRKIYSRAENPKNYAGKPEIIRSILQAVLNQRKIDVLYRKPTPGASSAWHRSFKPYTLLEYRNGMYVTGVSEERGKDVIMLAIDRVEKIETKPATFHYPPAYNPESFFANTFGIHQGKSIFTVQLVFDREVAGVVRERSYDPSERFREMKDGTLEMTLKVNSLAQITSWLLGFGSHVTVKKPVELREIVKKEAKKTASLYR